MKRERRIAWICLIIAGLIEIVWAYFMKQSHGFTRLLPTLITAVFLLLSFFLLERGIRAFGIGKMCIRDRSGSGEIYGSYQRRYAAGGNQ